MGVSPVDVRAGSAFLLSADRPAETGARTLRPQDEHGPGGRDGGFVREPVQGGGVYRIACGETAQIAPWR